MLGGYQTYLQTPLKYHLNISVLSSQGITMNDTLTENQVTSSHLCENQMWKPIFFKRTNHKP